MEYIEHRFTIRKQYFWVFVIFYIRKKSYKGTAVSGSNAQHFFYKHRGTKSYVLLTDNWQRACLVAGFLCCLLCYAMKTGVSRFYTDSLHNPIVCLLCSAYRYWSPNQPEELLRLVAWLTHIGVTWPQRQCLMWWQYWKKGLISFLPVESDYRNIALPHLKTTYGLLKPIDCAAYPNRGTLVSMVVCDVKGHGDEKL